MNCTICNKPIKLVPSAKERAEKYGETASYYTRLFSVHPECLIEKRNKEVSLFLKSLDASTKVLTLRRKPDSIF